MKKCLLLIVLLLLTGCTVNYKLEIKDDLINEEISGFVSKEEYEINEDYTSYPLPYTIINFDQRSILGEDKFYYKKINKTDEGSDYKFKYTYKNNISKSNILNSCFENHMIEETDNYYHIHLSGKFYCLYSDKIDINVISNMRVMNTNGKFDGNNTYSWVIDSTDNIDITIDISKKIQNIDRNKKINVSIFQIIGLVIIIILSLITYILYKRKKNNT